MASNPSTPQSPDHAAPPQDAARAVARAEGIARSGRLFAAREAMTAALETGGASLDEDGWRRALALLARVTCEVWRAPLVEPLAAAAEAPGDASVLGALGSVLIREREPGLASAVFARARTVAPHQTRWLIEQVAALQLLGRNAEAVARLRAAEAPGFHAACLLAFNTLAIGELAQARALAQALVPTSPGEALMAGRIERMLGRADAVTGVTPLDDRDLRGWTFVMTGGLLLHVAPDGLGVRGRYPRLRDSEALLREVAMRIESVLEAVGRVPDTVVALDGPESRISGAALANLLRRPVDFVRAERAVLANGQSTSGFVSAYDFGAFHEAEVAGFQGRTPGQIVFAHAMSVASEQPFTPDFIGVLHERNTPPWTRAAIDDGGPAFEAAAVRRIVDADTDEGMLADLGDLVALAVVAQAAGVLPMFEDVTEREPLWVGSPVPRTP